MKSWMTGINNCREVIDKIETRERYVTHKYRSTHSIIDL